MLKTNILIKPLITERSLKDAEKGVYTFKVAKYAKKPEIADLLKSNFSVHPVKITTISMHGKNRFAGRKRIKVKRQDWKKAKVRIRKGEKIDLFETKIQSSS